MSIASVNEVSFNNPKPAVKGNELLTSWDILLSNNTYKTTASGYLIRVFRSIQGIGPWIESFGSGKVF